MPKAPIEIFPIIVTGIIALTQVISTKKKKASEKNEKPREGGIVYQRILETLFNYESENSKPQAQIPEAPKVENGPLAKKDTAKKATSNTSKLGLTLPANPVKDKDIDNGSLDYPLNNTKGLDLSFKKEDIVKGFIFSEIIAKPKSLKRS